MNRRESSLILLGWYTGLHVVPTLRDAGTQHTAFVAHPLFGAAQGQTQRRHLRTADVAQFDPLDLLQQVVDGIEVGGVGWQLLQMQPQP